MRKLLLALFPFMIGADSAPVMNTKITNNAESRIVDVELINGKNRLLTSAISGPGAVGDRFFSYALNGSAISDLEQNCTAFVAATCDFFINASATKTILVENISCFGGGNGIKFGQFLSKSGSGLPNGIEIFIRSEGTDFTFPLIKTTEDWKNLFASQAGTDFRLDIQAGSDQFVASFRPSVPIPILASGTLPGGDDLIRVRVQDNLSSGLSKLECAAFGYEEST